MKEIFKPEKIIIDGNALAFRSLFSHEMLSIKTKEKTIYTGMPFGFLKMILFMEKRFNPKNGYAVVWDGGSKRKKEIYPEYKKGRKFGFGDITFEDIINSLDVTKKLMKRVGIEQYKIIGEEGDDLICSFVNNNLDKNVLVLTNDHDMFQLLWLKNVRILRFKSKGNSELWDEYIFRTNYENLNPKFYPHLMALAGDKTDNIPGIRGIGEKKGLEILKKLSKPTIKTLYQEIDKIALTQSVREKLINGKEDAFKFLKIVKLKKDLKLEPLYKPTMNKNKLEKYFQKLKFLSILKNEEEKKIICGLSRIH